MSSKRNASMIIGISMGHEICLIFGQGFHTIYSIQTDILFKQIYEVCGRVTRKEPSRVLERHWKHQLLLLCPARGSGASNKKQNKTYTLSGKSRHKPPSPAPLDPVSSHMLVSSYTSFSHCHRLTNARVGSRSELVKTHVSIHLTITFHETFSTW